MTLTGKKPECAFGRTQLGQAVYDIYMSSMSAAECARRHPISREFVLEQRRQQKSRKPKRKGKR